MAEIPPSNPTPGPAGAVPPPKKETGKVQPKKDTVSISLNTGEAATQAAAQTGAPQGAMPPPKKETGKVQPKKETVRINLPPKSTAAPTIKLPTLPPGGPTGASGPMAAAPGTALRTAAAPTAAAAPAKTGAAPTAAQKPAPAPAAARPAAPVVPSIKPLDKILIYSAAVAGLVAVGGVVWVFLTLKNVVENFSS